MNAADPELRVPAAPANPAELAARGWASRLAWCVVWILVVESFTGIWIWLAPFSIASQLQVVAHTLLGIALLAPFAVYQVRHLRAWWRQKLTAVMFLGYALLAATLVCCASGLVATWQALFGPRLSPTWDDIHLVSGLGILVLLPIHLLLAWQRRGAAARQAPELARAARGFTIRVGALSIVSLVLIGAVAGSWPSPAIEFDVPEDYSLPAYAQSYDEYRGNPFAPTFARTASGKLIDPKVLSGSESCGTVGCHEQVLAEWQPSAHRFSAMNPPFQQAQKNFASEREPAETRYCAGCHDPISLFAGAKDIHNLELSAPGMQEGSSCIVCHSISKVDQRGNADYELTPPHKYLGESATGVAKFVSDFLIRAYPRQHLADYDRNLMRTPEFCGACHKQFIPEALNRFGLAASQNQFDEWRKSHWHVDDAQQDLACRDCHMRLVRDSSDPARGEDGDIRRAADDGAHRHHGTIATNLFMPEVMKLPHWEEQVRLTKEWIRGETVLPEIEHVWPKGPVGSVDVQAPSEVRPGDEVTLRVVVTNRKAGHNLITGPLDFMRAWVHMVVADQKGAVLAEWGGIDPKTRWILDEPGSPHVTGNSREAGTMVLEGLPMNGKGELLLKHELWNMAGGKGARVIFPRYSDNQVYRFRVPENAEGPLVVTAALNFRRYRQQFLDLVVPEMESKSGVYQSTVAHSSCETRIAVVAPPGVRER